MTPRPPYKWKSFWFGLLVLAFMGLACWDSQRWMRAVLFVSGKEGVTLVRDAGHTYAEWGRVPSHFPQGWEFFLRPASNEEVDWRQAAAIARQSGRRLIRVADAAIFFPFLFAWLAWLLWRWRRQKRLAGAPSLGSPD